MTLTLSRLRTRERFFHYTSDSETFSVFRGETRTVLIPKTERMSKPRMGKSGAVEVRKEQVALFAE